MDFLEDLNFEDFKHFDPFFDDFTQTLDCPDDPLDKVVEDFSGFANKPISCNDSRLTRDVLETFSFGGCDDDDTKTQFITIPPHTPEPHKEEQVKFRSFVNKKRRSNKRRKEPTLKRGCCSHCQAEKTPQWRAGPLGPKSLCNACGLRYNKLGRLLPEYRPAASPSFDSLKHSNFHKKIMKRKICYNKDT